MDLHNNLSTCLKDSGKLENLKAPIPYEKTFCPQYDLNQNEEALPGNIKNKNVTCEECFDKNPGIEVSWCPKDGPGGTSKNGQCRKSKDYGWGPDGGLCNHWGWTGWRGGCE